MQRANYEPVLELAGEVLLGQLLMACPLFFPSHTPAFEPQCCTLLLFVPVVPILFPSDV